MIKLDMSQFRVDHRWVKRVTTGSNGRVTVVNEEESSQEKEVYEHLQSDWAIVRRFQKSVEASHFFTPVLCAIAYYENKMVAMEMNPLGAKATEVEVIGGVETRWLSEIEKNFRILLDETAEGDWFIDGYRVYRFLNEAPQLLSADGRFSSIPVESFKLIALDSKIFLLKEDRVCLGYATEGDILKKSFSAVSPPIWKSLGNVGLSELKKQAKDTSGPVFKSKANTFQFDKVDEHLAVNVDFALKAAKDLSGVFGYTVIEPLNLPYLMIQLKTVNLPTVDKSIRSTYDVGIKFTHAMAWLIGLIHRVNTLDSYMAVRGVMKYLTGIGIYRKTAFKATSVYKKGYDKESIPVMSMDEALEKYQARLDKMDLTEWLELRKLEESRGSAGGVSQVGGLVTDD